MTDEPEARAHNDPSHPADETDESGGKGEKGDLDDAENRAVRALLRRSLSKDGENAPELLRGVQRRIRLRSRGKFFSDGWSTTQARANYALVGFLTVLLAALVYYMLSPMGMR